MVEKRGVFAEGGTTQPSSELITPEQAEKVDAAPTGAVVEQPKGLVVPEVSTPEVDTPISTEASPPKEGAEVIDIGHILTGSEEQIPPSEFETSVAALFEKNNKAA